MEIRRRTSIAAVLFFSAAALTLIAYSITAPPLGAADRARLLSGVLWILLFFSASSGLPRAFVREEESGTALGLRKIGQPEAVLAGKTLFNFLLFSAICLVAAPLLAIFEDWKIERPWGFAAVAALAGLGMTLVSTFLSAIVSRAGQRDVLFVLIAFPLLIPLLLPAVAASALAASPPEAGPLLPYFQVLLSYDGLAAVGAFVLMRYIWEG